MKTTTIHITCDEEKLAALNIYLTQKNLTIEGELQSALETLYHKHVPNLVRDYVALRTDSSPEPFVPAGKQRPANGEA